jgi:hypothetical protein
MAEDHNEPPHLACGGLLDRILLQLFRSGPLPTEPAECQYSIFHTPTDFVVNQEASDAESGLCRESLLLDNVWTTFCRRIRDLITSMISMA